jgi:hypothetical protein
VKNIDEDIKKQANPHRADGLKNNVIDFPQHE